MRNALTRRQRATCAVVATASLALAAGCHRPAAQAWAAGGTRPAPERRAAPNVLLITIDTLRADAVVAYGNRSASTPWIDRLASAGVRFAQARASAVVTLPSHATILSGLYPFHHGVRENAGF